MYIGRLVRDWTCSIKSWRSRSQEECKTHLHMASDKGHHHIGNTTKYHHIENTTKYNHIENTTKYHHIENTTKYHRLTFQSSPTILSN